VHKQQNKTVPIFKTGRLAELIPPLKYKAHYVLENRQQNSELSYYISP
jgi:hypothetical protein